jgi:hypothetical protein
MANKRAYLLTGFIAAVFTLFFYHQLIGLNLLLFELILLPLIIRHTPVRTFKVNGWLITTGVAVTAIFTFVHASSFVITMNLVALFIWLGWLLLPDGRSMVSFAGLAFENLILAPVNAFNRALAGRKNHQRTHHLIRQAAYLILPLFLILFFILIYSASNPHFATIIDKILRYPDKWLNLLWPYVNLSLTGVLVLGLFTAVLFVFRNRSERIPAWDGQTNENLYHQRREGKVKSFRMLALKNEFRAGVFLLIILNLLIMLQNVLDIWYVWFQFEWNGEYLRQFVHEGTYLLILSILISLGIILWLYRGNLNFFPGNRILRKLSYAWLIQNMILVVSVAIRNGWYINYFALAYKRIGVFIFLVLTLVGLITVLIKVSRHKTPFFILRVNSLAVFILLVVTSLVNWDVVIARYNFTQYQRSFVHLDWLCTLSDKTLPVLDKPMAELSKIRQVQDRNFTFDHKYMSPEKYHEIIQQRKRDFIRDWNRRSILSFNLADYRAWLQLTAPVSGPQPE